MGENLSSSVAQNLGLEKSLLERLFEYYPFDADCKLKLLENFRSYEEIVRLSSYLFYEDSLLCNKKREGFYIKFNPFCNFSSKDLVKLLVEIDCIK